MKKNLNRKKNIGCYKFNWRNKKLPKNYPTYLKNYLKKTTKLLKKLFSSITLQDQIG